MSGVTSIRAAQFLDGPVLLDEQRHMVLEDVSWEFYENTLRELRARSVRITFDQGRMEIMSPLPEHERPAHAIGAFILLLAMELDIRSAV